MMHVSLLVVAIATSILLRLLLTPVFLKVSHWLAVLSLFIVPPLLLITTAVAIIVMGPHGHLVGPLEGWFSYGVAWLFLGISVGLLAHLSWQAAGSIRQLQQYPQSSVGGILSRVVAEDALFSAQVGLWTSDLVVSQGLIDHLDSEHLTAVIAHERAHAHYRDTFWFFWLGWLRRLSCVLPYTDDLWQELLLLREIRADSWAARFVDRLTLAESLVQVISAPMAPVVMANFSCMLPASRLSRRIDALLADATDYGFQPRWSLMTYGCLASLAVGLFPLFSIPFHY